MINTKITAQRRDLDRKQLSGILPEETNPYESFLHTELFQL